MSERLNYHHLYYFKVIASEGSISKAAQKLGLGQPTLSMQLSQFEEALGVEIFERKNRSLVLTELGRMVLGYANEIFRLGDEMLDSVHDRSLGKGFRVQIGAIDSVPKILIKHLLDSAFRFNECQVSVFEGRGPELIDELLDHKLDLVISNRPPPSLTGAKVFVRSLVRSPLIVVGAQSFLSLQLGFPQSLTGQPMILPTAHSHVRNEINHYFEQFVLRPQIVAETQDTSLMKTLALEGKGLIVISEPAVRESLKSKELVKVGELEKRFEEIWLIATDRKLQNPVAQYLMKDLTLEGLY